jgi:hypothetical protein
MSAASERRLPQQESMTVYAVRPFYSLPFPSHTSPESECCDGSDEPSGLRPNICAEVGVRHRVLLEQEAKLRKSVCFPLFISRIPPQFGTYLGLRNPRILRRFRQEGEGPSWWSHQFRQTGSRRAY